MTETHPHPWQNQDSKEKEIEVEYCIVGAGIGGLYAAVRLSQAQPRGEEPPRICILESSKRIGGRIASIPIPKSAFYADLGAMRFIPEQPLLGSLVEHLGLHTFDYEFPTDFFFVRGQRIPHANVVDGTQKVYLGDVPGESKKEPGELVVHAIARALEEVVTPEQDVPSKFADTIADTKIVNRKLKNCYQNVIDKNFKAFTPKEWRTIKLLGRYPNVNGLSLWELGFWDVVQSQLSSEAYSFVDEGLGYQTIVGTWNAADAIPWFLFDFGVKKYLSVEGGMGRIPIRLLKTFLTSMARRRDLSPFNEDWVVAKETTVRQVCWHEADGIVDIDAEISVPSGTAQLKVKAKHCILCVSKGAAKRIKFKMEVARGEKLDLKQSSVMFGATSRNANGDVLARPERPLIGRSIGLYVPREEKQEREEKRDFEWLLGCVEAQPLLKMFLVYKQAWWENLWQRATEFQQKKTDGVRVFTNLPLRQLYYHFGHSRCRSEVAGVPGEGMIMAYCDAKHASYWDALAFQSKSKKYGAEGLQGEEKAVVEEFGVSRHFAERAHEQIWRVHRGLIDSTDLPADMKEESDFTPPNETGKREKEVIAASAQVLFKNWMHWPFCGGWHAWRIGVLSDDIKAIWERPWMDANIYFAGEVISSDQGWSEGALRSVERVLMHQLRNPSPRWTGTNERAQGLGFEGIEEYVSW